MKSTKFGSVTVYQCDEGVTINWPSFGEMEVGFAEKFSDDLRDAVTFANALTKESK